MDERSVLIAEFVYGVVIQATVLLRRDWNWPKIGMSIFLGLIVAAYGSDKTGHAFFRNTSDWLWPCISG